MAWLTGSIRDAEPTTDENVELPVNTLRIALEKVDFLPPTRVTDDTSVLTLKGLVLEPLLRWDAGAIRPALLSRWSHSPDGRCWQFFIRPGAIFHDGKPCTADDVIAFIDGILDAVDTFGMKWSYSRYLAHATIRAGGADSIIVENPEPFADILDILTEFYIARLAPNGSATLGTGPYRVDDFAPRQSASLALHDTANKDWPQAILVREVPSADERLRLLHEGAVDAALNLERVEGRLVMDAAFSWGQCINTMSVMSYLNCFSGIFASPDARLAVNLAVDGDYIAQEIFGGLAVPTSTIVSPFHLGMNSASLRPIPYDPGRARALMDKVGGPRELTLRTPTYMPERAPAISQYVADCLGNLGFAVDIDIQTDRPEYAREVGRKHIGDVAIFDSSPHSTYRVLNDKISSAEKAVWWQGFDDPEVEALIRTANRSVAPMDRESAYGRCLARLNAFPPWLYLINPVDVFAARPGVAPLAINAKGMLVIA